MSGTASADDLERQLGRAAAAHQRGDLVPVDMVGGGLGQRPGDPQLGELPHAPFVYQQVVVSYGLVARSSQRCLHRWPSCQAGSLSNHAANAMPPPPPPALPIPRLRPNTPTA